ncbi:MAG: hypothetical protein ACFFC3_02320 [Candidatus Odinarchaeota archaeon]
MAKKDKNQEKKNSLSKKNRNKINKDKIDKEGTKSTYSKEIKKKKYLSDEDMDLDIPVVPEVPKKKEKIALDNSDLSSNVLERIKKYKAPDIKVVLVNCERCKAIIPVPIPKNVILESDLPVVPISYVHRNLQKKDQHCLTIHLDHDFDIRRQRISDVVISPD